jgi:hypothetical protein
MPNMIIGLGNIRYNWYKEMHPFALFSVFYCITSRSFVHTQYRVLIY